MPPESSPRGSTNGTTAILALCFEKKKKKQQFLFFLLPEDLVTITTALTNPDGGRAEAPAT